LAFAEAGLVAGCADVVLASGVVHAPASPDTGHCVPAATAAASAPITKIGILMNISLISGGRIIAENGERLRYGERKRQ